MPNEKQVWIEKEDRRFFIFIVEVVEQEFYDEFGENEHILAWCFSAKDAEQVAQAVAATGYKYLTRGN